MNSLGGILVENGEAVVVVDHFLITIGVYTPPISFPLPGLYVEVTVPGYCQPLHRVRIHFSDVNPDSVNTALREIKEQFVTAHQLPVKMVSAEAVGNMLASLAAKSEFFCSIPDDWQNNTAWQERWPGFWQSTQELEKTFRDRAAQA